MSNEENNLIDELQVPYNRTVKLEKILHESGMKMLRVHIREGRRFTIMDLDKPAAKTIGEHLLTWSEASD